MSLETYQSFYAKWDQHASIRSKPRRVIQKDEVQTHFYPIGRQPLCQHPKIKAKGEEVIHYILVQSAFKFMHEIAVVEVDLINNIARKIMTGEINFGFSKAMRDDLLPIIIDEAYHAFVANDFINQVSALTGILPIKESRHTQFENTIHLFKQQLPASLHDALDVLAICIGESTLTQELFDMSREEHTHPLFKDIIIDHVADEGRHQLLFREMLKTFWKNLSNEQKDTLGVLIPEFLLSYISPSMHIEYDKDLLRHLHFNEDDIQDIILDIYKNQDVESVATRVDPITKNIIKTMEYAGVFEHGKTREAFVKQRFMA